MKLVTQNCFLTNRYNQLRLLVSCLIFFIARSSLRTWFILIRYTESNNHIKYKISKMGYICIWILVLIVLKQLHIISMPLNKDIHSRHRKQNGMNSMHIYFITNFYAPFHLENALSNIEKVFVHSIYHRLHLFTKILNYVDSKYLNSVWCIFFSILSICLF